MDRPNLWLGVREVCGPFLADKRYQRPSPSQFLALAKEQDTIYQEVLKHFAAESYVIPGLQDGDGN